MSEQPKKLKYCVNGEWFTSNTETYMDCYNPSTGAVIAAGSTMHGRRGGISGSGSQSGLSGVVEYTRG